MAFYNLACSRRSDSGARAKNKVSERAGKKRGLPSFFPLFRSLYFSLALHYLNAWNRLFTTSCVGSRDVMWCIKLGCGGSRINDLVSLVRKSRNVFTESTVKN